MTASPQPAAAPTPPLLARALRSSVVTAGGFTAAQALRLLTNLVLTRLLFPEAFGMLALIMLVITALQMLSDLGVSQAIMSSPRGEDRRFLDTAWTVQILRGILLWAAAAAASPLLARVYGQPDLALYLPVAALTLIVSGLHPTRLALAHRHLRPGLVTLADLISQAAGALLAIGLAWATASIWALVLSTLAASLLHLALLDLMLPGERDRLGWDRDSLSQLVGFGRWIFLATVCGFLGAQADKAILGAWLELGHFGVFSIGQVLASLPFLMGSLVMGRLLIPVFRESPPAASDANRRRVRRMRAAALAGLGTLSLLLAFGGDWLVRLLYDPRYYGAGGIVVLAAVAQLPAVLILTGDQAALGRGDSRRFFVFTAVRATLVVLGLLVGVSEAGLAGALVGQGVANLLAYPALAWLLRPHRAWDPLLDAAYLLAAGGLGALALWAGRGALAAIPG